MKMIKLMATLVLLVGAVAAQSLRGSSELKRVPLAAETEQFEATQSDESEHITARLEAAHAQHRAIPAITFVPLGEGVVQ